MPVKFVCERNFWWRHIWRHLRVMMLQCLAKFSNVLVHWSIRMILRKNYETVSKFLKVMTKILWPLFFQTRCSNDKCGVYTHLRYSSLFSSVTSICAPPGFSSCCVSLPKTSKLDAKHTSRQHSSISLSLSYNTPLAQYYNKFNKVFIYLSKLCSLLQNLSVNYRLFAPQMCHFSGTQSTGMSIKSTQTG